MTQARPKAFKAVTFSWSPRDRETLRSRMDIEWLHPGGRGSSERDCL